MFPARKGAGHRRRRRGPVAIGVAVLGAGAAGVLLLSPAHAGTVQPPVLGTVAQPPAPAPAALSARIAGAVKADSGPARAPLAASTTTKSSGTAGTTVDPKIIGGTTTTISTAPWMAQLWYYDDNGTPADETDDTGFFCGGTVVSPTKILTASHCVHGYDWFQFGAVVTGTDQLPTTNADDTANLHGGTATGVQRQWNHPSYSSVTYDNDVAVLTLNRPVTAKPLPITTAGDTASYGAGTAATLYGWGRTSSTTQDLAQTLKKASMPIVSNAACSSAWGSDYVAAHMVCAGPPASGSDAGTTSACNGDSGGPLVVAGRVVGVVSWGVQDCVEKGAYSVFSRVSAFAGAIDPRLDDTDITHDGKADLLAVTPAGATYYYASKGTTVNGRVADGNLAGTGMIRQTDLNRDGFQDVLARTTDGQLYFLNGQAGTSDIRLGAGWNAMRALVAPGDLNGDGLPDLVATDTGGTMWYYPGNGNGTVGARHSVGGGWNIYNGVIYGKGDLSGDGRPDLVARDSAGVMWLYKGSGSATKPFQTRTRIGAGWNIYNIIATVGDITGDGHADLVARDSSGVLWLYKGTGSATAPLAARTEICAGWNIYNKLG
ncbi:trypsin-like serine protease [Actinacidiphila bryophytorum]|uniref:Repeat domain-containing protein n=2 Tax=Actinacidiphila bryophytorum TaxID=1436133 RepID=A0A9W4GZ50_9ACTN|nr:trypsin-like serine protease [Actinacidiphila bryophytorum]MBM9435353.1 trypsin-like serine protease [Actinacidiphila bryophytorum]CAG7607149.1 Repeat domain-containing protein [Actinacidiphila bryophytorum]